MAWQELPFLPGESHGQRSLLGYSPQDREESDMTEVTQDAHMQSILTDKHGMFWTSLTAQKVKNLPATQKTQVRSLGWEDPLEKRMATHYSIFTWRIPWTEEPGGLQSMGVAKELIMTQLLNNNNEHQIHFAH